MDDLPAGDLRDLAVAVRNQPNVRAVVLGGRSDTGGASLVAALSAGPARRPMSCASGARRQGRGGGKGDVAVAGGKDPGGVDEALSIARRARLLDGAGGAGTGG